MLIAAAALAIQPLGLAHAQEPDRTLQPEEEDFKGSPFTRYGDFNDEQDEAADTLFFQFGRLFGVSLGLGMQGVSGHRGTLYQGGFPLVDLKIHYWFDFNFALDLQFSTVQHKYETFHPTRERVDLTMNRLGVDLKYYFDTKDLAAPVSSSNPYILFGAGAFSKTENSDIHGAEPAEGRMGFSAGGGLEFTIRPKKSYFYIEGKVHHVTFEDTSHSDLAGEGSQPRIPDRTGLFFTMTTGILFTW